VNVKNSEDDDRVGLIWSTTHRMIPASHRLLRPRINRPCAVICHGVLNGHPIRQGRRRAVAGLADHHGCGLQFGDQDQKLAREPIQVSSVDRIWQSQDIDQPSQTLSQGKSPAIDARAAEILATAIHGALADGSCERHFND
jgi:hypothetical protein